MESEEKFIEDILSKLTLKEKSNMIHAGGLFKTNAIERLNIPAIKTSDGPMGVRKEFKNARWIASGTSEDFVTYLPSNTALASTWNKELSYKAGSVLGNEARGRGKDMILAPGINIQRDPLCGRNFEYMSEDPKLIEEMVVPFIEGVQKDTDVSACVKHFAVNSQETDRMEIDTNISERALREIYFPGFRAAVKKAKSHAIMGAYNKLRGEHCSQSHMLLDGVLRSEWGYDGLIVSDWGAVHDTKQAAESALDLEMNVKNNFDEYYLAEPLIKAVENKEIDETYIDEKIRDILKFMLKVKMIGPDSDKRASGAYNLAEHRKIAEEEANQAVVLLKNEDRHLPLNKEKLRNKKVLVVGQNAARLHSNGGGSSEIKALYEISPLMGICMELGGNTDVKYVKGYHIPYRFEDNDINLQKINSDTPEEEKEFERIINEKRSKTEDLELTKKKTEFYFNEAVELAKGADEVIFVGGLDHCYDVEGYDRKDMKLPYEQDRLIEKLLEVKPDMTVVMLAGAAIEMPWENKVKSLIWYSYAGIHSGNAIAGVLFGRINPSGKLPFTMPYKLSDTPAHRIGEFGNRGSITHKEGVYVGYRYYDTYKLDVMFPFGYGLSYTNFEYDDIEAEVSEVESAKGFNTDLFERVLEDDEQISPFEAEVSVNIKNTGTMAGYETVQLYISDLTSSVDRPFHELKAFEKVYLEPNESKCVKLFLPKEAFGFYDENEDCFKAEAGEFEIQVGSSSRDLRQMVVIELLKGYRYNK